MADIPTLYPVAHELFALRRLDGAYYVENWGAPAVAAIQAPLIWRSKPFATEQLGFDAAIALAVARQAAFMFHPEGGK